MHTSLRTLFAYEDSLFDAEARRNLERQITHHTLSAGMLQRIRQVRQDRQLGVPASNRELDPNLTAEYLDHVTNSAEAAEFESRCLTNDVALAEAAAGHQIIANRLGNDIALDHGCRLRCYTVTGEVKPESKLVAPKSSPSKSIVHDTGEVSECLRRQTTRHRRVVALAAVSVVFLVTAFVVSGAVEREKRAEALRQAESRRVSLEEAQVIFPAAIPATIPLALREKVKAEAFVSPTFTTPVAVSEIAVAEENLSGTKIGSAFGAFGENLMINELASETPLVSEQLANTEISPLPSLETTSANLSTTASETENTVAEILVNEVRPLPNANAANAETERVTVEIPPLPRKQNPLRAITAQNPPQSSLSLPAMAIPVAWQSSNSLQVAHTLTAEEKPSNEKTLAEKNCEENKSDENSLAESKTPTESTQTENTGVLLTLHGSDLRPLVRAQNPPAVFFTDSATPPPLAIPAALLADIMPENLGTNSEHYKNSARDFLTRPPLLSFAALVKTPSPYLVFAAADGDSPWVSLSSGTVERSAITEGSYLLTVAPFQVPVELQCGLVVTLVGDCKVRFSAEKNSPSVENLPTEENSPLLNIDYGRLIITLPPTAQRAVTLRIRTERGGLNTLTLPLGKGIVFIDTFAAQKTETPPDNDSPAALSREEIIGFLPVSADESHCFWWRSEAMNEPLKITQQAAMILGREEVKRGAVNLPAWLAPPDSREVELLTSAWQEALQVSAGDTATALEKMEAHAMPPIRGLALRLWGDLGHFDPPLKALVADEDGIKSMLATYFREVVRRDTETQLRLTDAIKIARDKVGAGFTHPAPVTQN